MKDILPLSASFARLIQYSRVSLLTPLSPSLLHQVRKCYYFQKAYDRHTSIVQATCGNPYSHGRRSSGRCVSLVASCPKWPFFCWSKVVGFRRDLTPWLFRTLEDVCYVSFSAWCVSSALSLVFHYTERRTLPNTPSVTGAPLGLARPPLAVRFHA